MGIQTVLTTTTPKKVREQPNVKAFLDTQTKGTATAYGQGLAKFQEFLNINNYGFMLNEFNPTFFEEQKQKNNLDVYKLLDSFKAYLDQTCGLSRGTIHNHEAAVLSYIDYCDIDINKKRYNRKVRRLKRLKPHEEALDDNDIRKILLACHNFRLKVFLLLLGSGGFRAREALGIRLKDIDFSVIPTRIHIREDTAKTGEARDVYISEEATTYLKQWIDRKYNVPVQYKDSKTGELVSFMRTKNENDLIFQMLQKDKDNTLSGLYNKMMLKFQAILKSTGLDKRKERGKVKRRVISFHSFRRHVKTVLSDNANTDYSEYILGHTSSTYYRKKEADLRSTYLKCMPFLTYTNYSQLEQDIKDLKEKQSDVEDLRLRDANKNREIELLKQNIQVKDKEIELLKKRDIDNADRIDKLEEEMNNLYGHIKTGTKRMKEEFQPKLKRNLSISEGINESISTVAKSLNDIQKAPQMTDKQKLTHLLEAIGNMVVQVQTSTASTTEDQNK